MEHFKNRKTRISNTKPVATITIVKSRLFYEVPELSRTAGRRSMRAWSSNLDKGNVQRYQFALLEHFPYREIECVEFMCGALGLCTALG